MITGIICEYNPFHTGHKKQLDIVRSSQQPEDGIVCLMSGNYLQRGKPAIIDKSLRARAAVLSGADLVLELPVNAAISSAESFAATGVEILSKFCNRLCFGAESCNEQQLYTVAKALLSEEFTANLKTELKKGISFPAARSNALRSMGMDGEILTKPNNILAIEYYKAIISQNSKMQPFPIHRAGDYHDTDANADNPSATSIRSLMCQNSLWEKYLPEEAVPCFQNATLHTIEAGERAILAKLRTMTDAEFEALPFSTEGLWRKLMHAARKEATLESIIAAVKSKRYTRTRIDRMILCAFLGIDNTLLYTTAPYVRVLAFNDKGRKLLKTARKSGCYVNAGEHMQHPWQQLEDRIDNLYGLFAEGTVDAPDAESRRRVFYFK